MKVCVLLVCALCVCWRTEAQSRSYLITAPVSLRLDSVDSVLLQLFGFTDEVTVYVFLKTSMAPDHVVLAREVVSLNAQNQHQAVAKVRLFPDQLERSVQQVVLHVQSAEINRHLTVPVSRSNGFLFIQTDKPLYTPHQSVKVRAFSLNQELRPANRSVFLTFKDPDQTTVDTAEMIDVNNGLPSLQNPFKIPVKPKLGIWSIEASYSNDFTTTARTDFEVKEYVLPSFSILVEPEANYISYSHFSRFTFKVSAHYLHGAPVAEGEVFLRYGYVSGKNPPVVIPNSITRDRLSSDGDLDVTVNMQKLLSKHEGPKDLDSLLGKYLYIAVLLEESTGAITQEAEFASVKFVKSPYTLSLVSTPPFIKPGLPYNIQLLVKDHLGKPVSRVGVRLVERQLFREGQDSGHMPCPASSTSQPDGLALFICNPPVGGVRAVLTFETTDPALPATSQARLRLEAVAYHSPNRRYLYIDAPLLSRGLQVGRYANIEVYSATPAYLHVKALSYLVLSKGKLVHFGTQLFVSSVDNKQNLNFLVTAAMVPSVRLLVFYIVDGEGVRELVADSVWLDVKDTCVNGLRTDVSLNRRSYKPKENLRLDIRTNQDGLVALTAADSALFTLRPNYRDPVTMVQRHLEASDQGCGGGGGRDNADVFHLAGLTFITNANAQAHSSSAVCTAAVRVKRALSNEAKTKKVESYGMFKSCCQRGLMYIPKIMTCEKFSQQLRRKQPGCRSAFKECCEFAERHLDLDRDLVLGRHDMGTDFDVVPSLVRSYFPESWMWEVQPVRSGSTSISRSLPDSLTTWEVRAVGVFFDGVCVAEPVQVSVSLPLSVDVPLPYQVVRGEQVELRGSVYNQEPDSTKFCVTLTLGPEFCLLQSQPVPQRAGLHSTACTWSNLPAGGVGAVAFTLMGLEPGEHTLTFTLRTPRGHRDIMEKKLRVVPEGVRQEMLSGGTLDPRGLYGLERRTVLLRNQLPPNMVPNTAVQRVLTITGEVLGDVLSLATSEDGLRQLVNLPVGSAEAELGGLLPLVQVYQYLETTRNWEVLGGAGGGAQKNAAEMRRKIRQGVVSISSFRRGDFSYSPWVGRESSTWLTALVVRTLSAVDQVVSVDHQSLSHSVAWLIRSTQQGDGSFTEKSSFRGNKVLAAGGHPVDQSVYLTSFVLIALKRATSIKDQILQLRFHDSSMDAAASYISERARDLRSVHVRAVACYALTLHDPDSVAAAQLMGSLERVARQKGLPAVLRYWQESHVTADWLRPDQSSGQTVETTALVLLTMLLKGRIPYANPILAWLTQDQHYGEGFYSIQDTTLTLEALTEYSRTVSRAVINQDINIRLGRRGELQHVTLSQSRPVATPMQVQTNDDITVSTGYGSGVSTVKLKTVYYQTTPSLQSSCNFHLNIELLAPQEGSSTMRAPHLVACAKYRPPPNEVHTESSLTLMKIQLPTGVEAHLEDLRQFRDLEDPIVSHFELQGNVVIIQLDTVPSDMFLCVGFRVRVAFKVGRATESVFTVSEPQDRGSLCTKQFSYQEQKLQRLCEAEQCQCMTGACATFRGTIDSTLTAANRSAETCRPHVRYAYKVSVRSAAAEGDFMTFTATVVEVLKNSDTALEAVSSGTEVELVQKATCSDVVVQVDKQYLVMGAAGSEVRGQHGSRYRLPLDSDALVERWPTDCSSPECLDYISQLNDFSLNLQLLSCP